MHNLRFSAESFRFCSLKFTYLNGKKTKYNVMIFIHGVATTCLSMTNTLARVYQTRDAIFGSRITV